MSCNLIPQCKNIDDEKNCLDENIFNRCHRKSHCSLVTYKSTTIIHPAKLLNENNVACLEILIADIRMAVIKAVNVIRNNIVAQIMEFVWISKMFVME